MRNKGTSREVEYMALAREVEEKGSATFKGEERVAQGKGLDPLVDPSQYGVVRQAKNLLVPDGDGFVLEFGIAMPVENQLDTTGSMGGNVDIAFKVLPKVQKLLGFGGKKSVLSRYHTQIATSLVQDVSDFFAFQRTQFEPDNEVERQMNLLAPQKAGGDETEDYQLGLFALAFLTDADIWKYGLKGYAFVVGDERGRNDFDEKRGRDEDRTPLERVFGPEVFEKAGLKKKQSLPTTKEVAKIVCEKWHVFYLQVDRNPGSTKWWKSMIGSERTVLLPRTEDLAEVQACLIGLTEGVLNLQSARDFLQGETVAANRVEEIVRACSDIPLGLQKSYPNFAKIPMAGARFASREDIWPIGSSGKSSVKAKPEKPSKDKDKKDKKKDDWQL